MAMTNLEKYDYAFMSNFRASKSELPSLKYEGLGKWDSVTHMDLIADLESAFDAWPCTSGRGCVRRDPRL